jgi:hypothetical protein
MTVGFGTGLVVCVEEQYFEWTRAHASPNPSIAQYLGTSLTGEAQRSGQELHPAPPMLGWALSTAQPVPSAPEAYRLERVDKAWMDEWQRRDVFTNALGHAIQAHRTFRNQFACVLFDASDEWPPSRACTTQLDCRRSALMCGPLIKDVAFRLWLWLRLAPSLSVKVRRRSTRARCGTSGRSTPRLLRASFPYVRGRS